MAVPIRYDYEDTAGFLWLVLRLVPSFALAPPLLKGLPKNFSVRFHVGDSALIEAHGVAWLVSDNGGELCVEKVNESGSLRNVPCEMENGPALAVEVASHVAAVLREEAMNFKLTWTEEDQETMSRP